MSVYGISSRLIMIQCHNRVSFFELIAFDKERIHNTVKIYIFGLSFHGHQFGLPENFLGAKLFRGQIHDVISIKHVLGF